MKKILTEKNLMWVAIAALVTLQLFPGLFREERKGRSDVRQRMSQMRERMGPQMEKGREARQRKSDTRLGAPKKSK